MSLPKKAGVEDLSIRARRGGLSAEEQRVFDRACAASPTLRVAHRVGRAFDRVSGVRAGDEELIARVADRVLAPVSASRSRAWRRRWSLGFGIAAVLVSSVAAAWWVEAVRPGAAASPAIGGEPGAEPPIGARHPGARERRLPDVSLVAERSAAVRGERSGSARVPANDSAAVGRGTGDRDIDAVGAEDAAGWFRRANAARRAGDFAAAAAFYGKLQASFPGSDEARLSHVSLGKLRLASGDAADAERQFSLYLAEGSGELAEEALAGRAESLQRLGRRTEERQSWQRLVRDFGSSVYAARAKQRLEELGP
jgi:TolA-binding protein